MNTSPLSRFTHDAGVYLDVLVRSVRIEAESIRSYELVAASGSLPAWTPGAHVQLSLPGQLKRAYSLCNHRGENACYRIAVKLESQSRGGSRAVHQLAPGDRLRISPPQNLFEPDTAARRHVLIAGGIGITPLYAMSNALGDDACEMHYFTRDLKCAAFADRLTGRALLHAGLDSAATAAALHEIVTPHADDERTTFYTCGPSGFMSSVETALLRAGVPPERLRSERFGAEVPTVPLETQGAAGSFHVVFARSAVEALVPSGVPIIVIARQHGIDIPTSCEQGVCGACETGVLEGVPEHHDAYLSDAERASGKILLPCVSRCTGGRLVLDR
ncbi:MAG: Oxidoreductase [Rhodocyclales bacterium]|nr:Oxidoreductase [Rhodocyclales bacterium]